MARRIGIKGDKVVSIISEDVDTHHTGDISYVDVPRQLEALSDQDLLTLLVVRDGKPMLPGMKKPLAELKLAFVGCYGIPCGISTYSEALWPRMWGQVGSWRLFSEEQPGLADSPNVVTGLWKRGQSLAKLAEAIEAYEPDAVFIQHEYGIFPDAKHWLSFMARIKPYRPIVTLHSVYTHKDKTICEAAIPEIVVHSKEARAVLTEEKGIKAPVSVIKHGCGDVRPNRLYNLYQSEHTFMQFGFGFRYKNWEAPIRATAILKKKYPDVFFTGLFSEGMFSKLEHQRYYDELMALAAELGVSENIAIIRGYQSEQVIDSYLGTNQAAVFAYKSHPEHIVYGASGASRRAMETGIPVVVSREPHFCDLEGVCPVADNAEQIAEELSKLFEDWKIREELVKRQNKFMTDNSWQRAADAYLDMVVLK